MVWCLLVRRYDTQNNDIKHQGLIPMVRMSSTQHNNGQHSAALLVAVFFLVILNFVSSIATLSITLEKTILSITIVSIQQSYADCYIFLCKVECHIFHCNAECRYVDCHDAE